MTITYLKTQRDRVALEAAVDLVNMGKLFKDAFPAIGESLKGFLGLFRAEDPPIKLTRDQQAFVNMVSKTNYLEVAPIAAYVPEGMKLTWLDYMDRLEPAVVHSTQVLDEVMNEFTTFMGGLLNNHDHKYSTQSFERKYQMWEKERQAMHKALAGAFDDHHGTQTSIGKVIDRNADWATVFKRLDAMVNTLNGVSRDKLNAKIAEASMLIDRVIAKGVDRKELDDMSPQTMANLSEGAYGVAREVEFYTAVYYKVDALANAVTSTMEHFAKVHTRKKA